MTVWLGREKCCRWAKNKIDRRRRFNDQVEEEGELDDSNHPGSLRKTTLRGVSRS